MTEPAIKSEASARTKTFAWDDPMLDVEAARSLSGFEFLTKMMEGEVPVPPVMKMIGFRLLKVERGTVAFQYDPHESHYNPIGSVHGGILTTVLDSVMGCCIHTTLPMGVGYTTLEVKVNFVRAVSAQTGVMRCEGSLIHSGSRVATSEARIVDKQGKLYAHANTTCLILSPQP